MNAFLVKAASYKPKTPKGAVLEVEIGQTVQGHERDRFANYVKNWINNVDSAAVVEILPVQRCDIQFEGTHHNIGADIINDQCRIFYEGMKEIKREYLCKNTQLMQEHGVEHMSACFEIPLTPRPITKPTLVVFKNRLIYKMKYWYVDFLAYYRVRVTDPVTVNTYRSIRFKEPMKVAADFLDILYNKQMFFSGYRVEFEIIDGSQITENMEELIKEYECLNRVVYGTNINAMRYQNLLKRLASTFHTNPNIQSIKQITPQAKTLDNHTFKTTFPFTGWFVSEKADGIRSILYLDSHMNIYLFGTTLQILRERPIIERDPKEVIIGEHEGFISIIDGEYIEELKIFLIFDVIVHHSVPHYTAPFAERVKIIPEVVEHLSGEFAEHKIDIKLVAKEFVELPNITASSVEYTKAVRGIIERSQAKPYKNDGLVYISPSQPYLSTMTLKWKRSEDNTVDFLARSPPKINPMTNYKEEGKSVYLLFCSTSKIQLLQAPSFPMTKMLFPDEVMKGTTCPVLFHTSLSNSLFYLNATEDLDGKIVEVAPEWANEQKTSLKWRFIKVREDRALDLSSGRYYGNYLMHAEQNLLMYVYPITVEMLCTGPDSYFSTPRNDMYKASAQYNNFNKMLMLREHSKNCDHLLDLAGGRGSDIYNYFTYVNQKVFVLEKDPNAINEMIMRKQSILGSKTLPQAKHPQIMIIEHDLTAKADLAIARLQQYGAPVNEQKQLQFNIVTCHFALHYFAKDDAEIKNVVQLVKSALTPGGLFMFTIFSMERVNALLAANGNNWQVIMADGTVKYNIRRAKGLGPNVIELILPFSGGSYYEETLVDLDKFIAIAQQHELDLQQRFGFADNIGIAEASKYVRAMKPEDNIYSGLYEGVIMSKRI